MSGLGSFEMEMVQNSAHAVSHYLCLILGRCVRI